jgi:hypothetical protein
MSTRSAFPAPVDELMPRARDLAVDLGSVPSRNRLMRELKIGAPKARELRDALVTESDGTQEPDPDPDESGEHEADPAEREVTAQPAGSADPEPTTIRTLRPWPVLLLAAPAFVAIWSGWVGLGVLAGFGVVHPLPGIWDDATINSAITLPVGMETYAAYALWVWLTPDLPTRARKFARWSAIGALALGAAGQVAYHLMVAAGLKSAPWQITTLVSCFPVAVLGMGAALAHLVSRKDRTRKEGTS